VKYVLVDKGDNIIENVDLESEVGVSGARTYFLKSKGIDKKEFDNMWKVMSQNQYNIQFKSTLQNRQIEWWKDDESYLDIDK
tara:strand:+ start:1199 stop:1444 length:246 start_codon:yes stop_codon:yes gene_type:complete